MNTMANIVFFPFSLFDVFTAKLFPPKFYWHIYLFQLLADVKKIKEVIFISSKS
jgi:hypothetical protein